MRRRLLARTFEVAAVLLGSLGTGLVLAGVTAGLDALALAVAAAVVVVGVEPEPPLGRVPVGRAVVLTGAVVAQLSTLATRPVWPAAGLTACVLVGLLAGERLLLRVGKVRAPVVAHLPGLPSLPPEAELDYAVVLGALACAAVGIGGTQFGWSGWWFLASAAFAVLPAGTQVVAARRRVVAARRRRLLLPAAVAAYAPRFVIYTSRPDDASYQIAMWLPYLHRTGLPFLVVARNGVPAAALAQLTDAPVVEARGLADLEELLCPSLRAVFYVNASSGNGALVRYQHLTHIYLGHGDSDKPPSYNPTHAMYDTIFVAGPAAIRRYADHGVAITADHFQIVGRPQVEAVQPAAEAVAGATRTVLYAPTWRGHVEETRLSSLLQGEQIVAALLAVGTRVVFRPHPFSHGFADEQLVIGRIHALLAEDSRRSGRAHLFGAAAETERGIADCINLSDAMVGDVSSVVSDYLFSGKPFVLVAVPAEPAAFVDAYPVARASYVVRGDLSDLDAALAVMLGSDPLAPVRRQVRADYLGDFAPERYASVFVDAVRQHALAPSVVADADEVDRQEGESSTGGRSWLALWRIVRRDIVPGGLALVALLLAVLPRPGGSTLLGFGSVLAGEATLAAVFWVVQRNFRDRSRRVRTLSTGAIARAVLVATLVVGVWRAGAGTNPGTAGWAAAVTGAALLLTLLGERALADRMPPPVVVADFPQATAPPPPLLSVGTVPASFLAATAVGLLSTVLVRSAWVPTALGLVPLLLLVVSAVRHRSQQQALSDEQRLQEALLELRPTFTAYFASPIGAAYQLGMWLPYFARIGSPFVILTRSIPMLEEIARTTRELGLVVPIVYRPTLRSLDDIVVPSLRAAFYVNNAVRNTHLIERRSLTHVWLNHGDSEKPACYNPVHAIYDLLFVAGEAGIDRYARHGVAIPRSKFRIVGRPQVERIEATERPVAEVSVPTVLYAPTWKGPYADSHVYSLPVGATIVRALLDRGVRVVFRAHPFNYRYPEAQAAIAAIGKLLAADRAATGRQHVWGRAAENAMTVEDCFNASDAMVADVSAVVSDYLRSGKPFGIVSVGRTPEQLLREAPAARAAYVLRDDVSNLDGVLDDLLRDDPLAGQRAETRRYYLGDIRSTDYAETFLAAAREVIDQAAALPTAAEASTHD